MSVTFLKTELELYFEQIDQVPLLAAEQERQLTWKIMHDNCPVARDTMIRANLRLVVHLAKRCKNRSVPLPDLIEEGNIGLLRAVDAFNPDQGVRFSTYASWMIKRTIKRMLINSGHAVHIPDYMADLITRFNRSLRELQEQLGRHPTIQELAVFMTLPVKKVRMIRKAANAFRQPTQDCIRKENRFSIFDKLEDDRIPLPDEQVIQRDQLETVRKLMEVITDREAAVLRLRFGLDGRDPMTLEEIGAQIGITRERVRQIQGTALRNLNERLSTNRSLAAV